MEHLSETITYQGKFPLLVSPLDNGQTLGVISNQYGQVNMTLLRMWWMLEERHTDMEEGSELSQDIIRLETKLDLVLSMLADVAKNFQQLPPETEIRITSTHLHWLMAGQGADISVGDTRLLECYIIPGYPMPLRVAGEVTAIDDSQGQTWISLSMDSLGELASDTLEKILFRYHRRAIASVRRST